MLIIVIILSNIEVFWQLLLKDRSLTIEAVKHPGWCKAMEEEIATLKCKGTWSLEDLSSGKKAIGSGWVYSIKYTTTGKVERFKGRLVVHGNRQIEGVDYRETFAPVAKMGTVYLFLVVAVSLNWELYHMDVQNAFLHGYLHKEVYMKLAGYRGAPPEKVCRLRKLLYGLKQAPRHWFAKLSWTLKSYDYKLFAAHYSLFSYIQGYAALHVLIYVDDLIIAGSSHDIIVRFKEYLSSCFI